MLSILQTSTQEFRIWAEPLREVLWRIPDKEVGPVQVGSMKEKRRPRQGPFWSHI